MKTPLASIMRRALSRAGRAVRRWRSQGPLATALAGPVLLCAGAVLVGLIPGSLATSRWFHFFVFLVDVGLLMLAGSLGADVVRRLRRRRLQNEPGAGFLLRTSVVVLLLALVPAVTLFVSCSLLLRHALEPSLSAHADALADDALRLQESLLAAHESSLETRARGFGERFIRRGLLRAGRKAQQEWLTEELGGTELVLLQVFDRDCHPMAEARVPGTQASPPCDLAALSDVMTGKSESTSTVQESGNPPLVVAYGRIAAGGRTAGYISVASPAPALPGALAANLTSRRVQLKAEAGAREDRVGRVILLLLLSATLIGLGTAWAGLHAAEALSRPVVSLAGATRSLAKGSLDPLLRAGDLGDLQDLARSLADMVEEVQKSRTRIESSTLHLNRSYRELDERRQYTETLLANIPAGVVSLDKGGTLVNFNASAARMLKLPSENCLLRHYRDVFAGKDFLELRVLIDKIIGVREIRLIRELKFRVANQPQSLAVSFAALNDAADAYMGMIIVFDDLTEFIQAQKIAAWREVARRIAHEIKNPLTPIKLSAQRIARRLSDPDESSREVIRDCTETIVQEVDSLKTLVDAFSRFARLPEVRPAPASINHIVAAALMPYETTHDDIEFETRLQEDIPTLNLDSEQLKRALVNLIDNAIAALNGKGHILIETRYNADVQTLTVEVADTGPGIPPEIRDKLFLPYFSSKKGGTGLGLAIVSRIMSDHRGHIRFEDNQPAGTRFIIEIPG